MRLSRYFVFSWLKIRKNFLSGLVFLLPFAVTGYTYYALFNAVDQSLPGDILRKIIGFRIPGLGLITTFFLIVAGGIAAKKSSGEFKKWLYLFLRKLPFGDWVIKLTEDFTSYLLKKGRLIDYVALIEYPCEGVFAVGFATHEENLRNVPDSSEVCIFLATSPNPTTGYFVMVPKEKVIRTSITAEDAVKIIMTGGVTL